MEEKAFVDVILSEFLSVLANEKCLSMFVFCLKFLSVLITKKCLSMFVVTRKRLSTQTVETISFKLSRVSFRYVSEPHIVS